MEWLLEKKAVVNKPVTRQHKGTPAEKGVSSFFDVSYPGIIPGLAGFPWRLD